MITHQTIKEKKRKKEIFELCEDVAYDFNPESPALGEWTLFNFEFMHKYSL